MGKKSVSVRERVILTVHAHPTWGSKQIAKSLHVNDRLVRKWQRWQEIHSLKDLLCFYVHSMNAEKV
jgi:hypothetical protein